MNKNDYIKAAERLIIAQKRMIQVSNKGEVNLTTGIVVKNPETGNPSFLNGLQIKEEHDAALKNYLSFRGVTLI